jgi:hypothetical protein
MKETNHSDLLKKNNHWTILLENKQSLLSKMGSAQKTIKIQIYRIKKKIRIKIKDKTCFSIKQFQLYHIKTNK